MGKYRGWKKMIYQHLIHTPLAMAIISESPTKFVNAACHSYYILASPYSIIYSAHWHKLSKIYTSFLYRLTHYKFLDCGLIVPVECWVNLWVPVVNGLVERMFELTSLILWEKRRMFPSPFYSAVGPRQLHTTDEMLASFSPNP